jgi:transposase-like protein
MPNKVEEIDAAAGDGAETGRRPSIVPAPAAASPELSARPKRRIFSAKEKLRILTAADEAALTGGMGALLRREGIYSSALTEWRRLRASGALGALQPAKRGPKTVPAHPRDGELTAAHRKIAQLERQLEKAEAIIDIQKKLSALLGIALEPTDPLETSS